MIVDSSALVAIVGREPTRAALLQAALRSASLKMGAPNLVETFMVIDGRKEPTASRSLDDLVVELGLEVVPFTAEHAARARDAFRQYGRGTGHPARLNFGDCCAYAVASLAREPLLFVGEDFTHTDIEAAL